MPLSPRPPWTLTKGDEGADLLGWATPYSFVLQASNKDHLIEVLEAFNLSGGLETVLILISTLVQAWVLPSAFIYSLTHAPQFFF